MEHREVIPSAHAGKNNNAIRDALFMALGGSKNVYLATKLDPEQSFELWPTRISLKEIFKDKIVDLPQEFHLTWSFLGTKSHDQLQAFHEKLVEQHDAISHKKITFNTLGWMRSFINQRPIIYVTSSELDNQWLLEFRQSLRMEERNPKRGVDEFTPHITLAQLSPEVTDDEMNTFLRQYVFSAPLIVPANSLWFFGKGTSEKISMQIY